MNTEINTALSAPLISPLSNDPASYAHFHALGNSGVLVPPISLGLWHNFGAERFNGGAEHDAVARPAADPAMQRDILRKAYALGITHLDLANNYGPPAGSAEETFGKILRSDFASVRDELLITTKAGYRMWQGPYGDGGSRKYLLSSLDQSLQRMGLEYVDIFYHHCEDAQTPLAESMGALATAVKSGKALYAGVSNYSPAKMRQAHALLAQQGVPLLVNQVSYSMLNRHIEQPQEEGESLLEVAAELGIGIVAFSPLQQGLLTDRYLHGVPKLSRAAQGVFLKENQAQDPAYLEKVQALSAIAAEREQNLAQLALAWVLRAQPTAAGNFNVSSAIVGASSAQQLEANHAAIAGAGTEFSAEELAQIEAVLSQ